MKMSNSTYDKLKVVSAIIGYCVTFILSMIDTWNVPHASQWNATVSGLGILLGSILLVSSKMYKQDMEEHADDPDEGRG